MEANKLGIHYTVYPPQMIASVRTAIASRKDILDKIRELMGKIPKDLIHGNPFCIFYYVTSVAEGLDVEYGAPVISEFPSDTIKFRTLPKLECFTLSHKGKLEDVGNTYTTVFKYAYKFGYPSQEFCREVYSHFNKKEEDLEIDVQFILHPWNRLLVESMIRVLGEEQQGHIMEGLQTIEIETPLEKKFAWLIGVLDKLEQGTNESQQYKILSGCAHFFPEEMISELRGVYENARKSTSSLTEAVDKTLEFMTTHKGWGSIPIRRGNVLYTTKNPYNTKAFNEASNHIERIKAYCYCPIIRNFLDQDISASFCNCGAGWVKQLWEGVFQQPLEINIVKNLTKGDEECQFVIKLPSG